MAVTFPRCYFHLGAQARFVLHGVGSSLTQTGINKMKEGSPIRSKFTVVGNHFRHDKKLLADLGQDRPKILLGVREGCRKSLREGAGPESIFFLTQWSNFDVPCGRTEGASVPCGAAFWHAGAVGSSVTEVLLTPHSHQNP